MLNFKKPHQSAILLHGTLFSLQHQNQSSARFWA